MEGWELSASFRPSDRERARLSWTAARAQEGGRVATDGKNASSFTRVEGWKVRKKRRKPERETSREYRNRIKNVKTFPARQAGAAARPQTRAASAKGSDYPKAELGRGA